MDLDKSLAERVAEREEKKRRIRERRSLERRRRRWLGADELEGEEEEGGVANPQITTNWRDWKAVYDKFDHVDVAIEMHGLITGKLCLTFHN